MRYSRSLIVSVIALATVGLAGCGSSKDDEEKPKPAVNQDGTPQKTSSQMPPEAKARMDAALQANKGRADAQGKAMQSGPLGKK